MDGLACSSDPSGRGNSRVASPPESLTVLGRTAEIPEAATVYADLVLQSAQELLERRSDPERKVVGYLPGGYVPEELIYAAGAQPVCLMHGSSRLADKALSVLPAVICPFARSLVGAMMGEDEGEFRTDLVVAPSTCQHVKKVAEMYEYLWKVPVFRLGVPYSADKDFELAYYRERLRALEERLGQLTGRLVTDQDLRDAISLYDRLRGLLKSLSMLRVASAPVLRALDLVRLNQASLLADPVVTVRALEELWALVSRSRDSTESGGRSRGPRIVVLGPNLAFGDYEILRLVEAAGAEVVAEDVFEGLRDCWHRVGAWWDDELEPLEALARAYVLGKRPAAFQRNGLRRRLEFVSYLAQEFDARGVIWYQLACCEFFDQESYFFLKALGQRGIPVLVVESDYHGLDTAPTRSRLEAFVEMLATGNADA